MNIEWKEAYETQIDEIDDQHKKLITMSNRLLQMVVSQPNLDSLSDLTRLVEDLKDYAVYHFNYEEALLHRRQFSGLEQHLAAHMQFIERIHGFEIKMNHRFDKDLFMEMLEFLTSWIANHIMVEDKKYARELQGQ